MRYVDYVYDIIAKEQSDVDALFGDYIISMVGLFGFLALRDNNLIEIRDSVNGRDVYVLRDKN